MKKIFIPLIAFYFLLQPADAKAQNALSDSAKVATTLTELLNICANVDFGDPKTQELGTFYKAASYIVYRGENEKRKWKDIADYTKPEDKKGVDEVCFKINSTVNQDKNYKFIQYRTETESEGTWYAIIVSYTNKRGVNKEAAFAFLKIKGKFVLGDID